MAGRFNLHQDVEARIWAAFVIGCAGAAAGEVYNALSPRGVFAPVTLVEPEKPSAPPAPRVRAASPRPAVAPSPPAATGKPTPPRDIDLAEARSLAEKKGAKFVDARSALRFASGHIGGAVSIPSADFDAAFSRVKAALPADSLTVVYCESADCDESDLVIDQLLMHGYRKLLHFKAGWQVWEDAGLPQARGTAP